MELMNLDEIRKETKKIRWLNKKEMKKDAKTTFVFMFGLSGFFVTCDFVISQLMVILRLV